MKARWQFVDFEPRCKTIVKYDALWPADYHTLTIELLCFRHRHSVEDGGLGPIGHFKEIVNILWGEDNEYAHFIWNPWSDRMLEEAINHKFLSVAGCASSGKSLFYAIYAIVCWLADPVNTTVLVTSTSLKESKGRIWADIEKWWNAANKQMGETLPGKLVSSLGLIKLNDPTGEYASSDRSGIHLIAGEKRKEKETIGKLIGYKNRRLLFIGDELPELSPALVEAATSNLDSAEKEWFQFIGIGNPNSIYDPHGQFSKPKKGWKSVNPSVFEWETDLGFCIRFDATQSPNILAGRRIYPWLPTEEKINSKRAELGEDSLAFWRMWRGFWCPTGGSESVVAEADLIAFDCDQKVERWKDNKFVWLAFLDAAFTSGGDRSIAVFAKLGVNARNNKDTLEYAGWTVVAEDTMKTDESHSYQIARKFKELCEAKGVTPDRAGIDDTGATSFGDIVHTVWSRQVMRLNFGGAATATRVSAHDKTLACDKYKNRVTEIWCSVREYIRGDQIRGIDPDFAIELTSRKMEQRKSGIDLKAQVEPKAKMRDRTNGKSPDIADAGLGLLDLARTRLRFKAAAREVIGGIQRKTWKKFAKERDRVTGTLVNVVREFSTCGQGLDRAA